MRPPNSGAKLFGPSARSATIRTVRPTTAAPSECEEIVSNETRTIKVEREGKTAFFLHVDELPNGTCVLRAKWQDGQPLRDENGQEVVIVADGPLKFVVGDAGSSDPDDPSWSKIDEP